ncbi:histone [Candidatus Hodarchaeum mangrovi]
MGAFQNARVQKLIQNAGAFRISNKAILQMNEILTDYGTKIAKYAVEIANHSGRKTVQESDIILASKR